jgi:hypothetical protein
MSLRNQREDDEDDANDIDIAAMSIQRRSIFSPPRKILIVIVFLLAAGTLLSLSPDSYLMMASPYLQTETDHTSPSHQHPSHEMMIPQYSLATNESRGGSWIRPEQNQTSDDSLISSTNSNATTLESGIIELPQEPKVVEATRTSETSNGNGNATTITSRPKKKSSSCWRRCPQGRTNSIVYEHFELAGLGDRIWILSKLMNLAGYLCATVHVPRPSDFLSPHHNSGEKLSNDLTWADFSNMTWNLESSSDDNDEDGDYYQDEFHNTQALRTIESHQTKQSRLNKKGLQQEGIRTGRWILPGKENVATTSSHDKKKAPALFLTTKSKNKGDGWKHLERVEEFVLQQQQQQPDDKNNNGQEYFLWNLQFNWYQSNLCRSENPSKEWKSKKEKPASFPQGLPCRSEDGCRYFQSSLPYHVKHIADSVWKEVEGSSLVVPNVTTVGILHIRRGDAQGGCNTTLPRMQSYIDCSFVGSETLGDIAILIASDEKDPIYLEEVNKMLQANKKHVKVLKGRLDDIVWKHARNLVNEGKAPERILNNFFIVAVVEAIRSNSNRIAFRMEQRRKLHCPDCEKLVDWTGVNWVGKASSSSSL